MNARGRGNSPSVMFVFTKRPGRRASFRFMPGCLLFSIVASIILTILLNVIIRAF